AVEEKGRAGELRALGAAFDKARVPRSSGSAALGWSRVATSDQRQEQSGSPGAQLHAALGLPLGPLGLDAPAAPTAPRAFFVSACAASSCAFRAARSASLFAVFSASFSSSSFFSLSRRSFVSLSSCSWMR